MQVYLKTRDLVCTTLTSQNLASIVNSYLTPTLYVAQVLMDLPSKTPECSFLEIFSSEECAIQNVLMFLKKNNSYIGYDAELHDEVTWWWTVNIYCKDVMGEEL